VFAERPDRDAEARTSLDRFYPGQIMTIEESMTALRVAGSRQP
jgi:hypothetical protein